MRPNARAFRDGRPVASLLIPTFLALALFGLARTSTAGPNSGGVLILHAATTTTTTLDCGTLPLSSCADANASFPSTEVQFQAAVIAAFPENALPRLRGVTFGLDYYPERITLVAVKSCGDFELTDSNWPAPGTGTAVTWDSPQTTTLTEIYGLLGYCYDGAPTSLSLIAHPTQGAYFADDTNPAQLDEIAGLGTLGFGQAGTLPCPADAALGACCFSDGSCTTLTEGACLLQSGLYQGDGVPCAPDPCPASGACCLNDGTCLTRTASACALDGGSYQGDGTVCEPNPCPEPQAACCLPDGSCTLRTQTDCEALGGVWYGVPVGCSPNPCPQPTGACCIADGTCVELTLFGCNSVNGVWQGPLTSCSPNPCPQPIGACCLPTGECVLTTRQPCLQSNGIFYGPDYSCDPNPCPDPLGACCLADGTCLTRTEFECEGSGGVYQGPTIPCAPNPCPQPCADPRDGDPLRVARELKPPSLRVAPSADAAAGPNLGGTMILHANLELAYTSDSGPYCGASGLATCQEAVTRYDEVLEPVVLFALAAFHPTSSPRLAALTFGINYGTCVEISDAGACSDAETRDPGWPASGTGTALSWESAQTASLVECYWFAAYCEIEYPEPLALTAHPSLGAHFYDDANPPHEDAIAALGAFGFFTNGYRPCPGATPTGACCAKDGSCIVVTQATCEGKSGRYTGNNTDCDPNPCGCGAAVAGPLDPTKVGPFREETGLGQAVAPALPRGGCGTVHMTAGPTYENGYAWRSGGVVAPYYGAFAECYPGGTLTDVCSVICDFTQIGAYQGQTCDVYVWSSADGCPGNVLCSRPNLVPGEIAYWPAISRHVFSLEGCCVDEDVWVGFWGNWPGAGNAWFIAADIDGTAGCPYTNISPGIGFPTGWQNVSVAWGPTTSLGIGCEIDHCYTTPVRTSTWGAIKSLFQGQERTNSK